ncbi:MAG: hypothetical protein AABZ16_11490, partial [candidate division NC10 bacterium]
MTKTHRHVLRFTSHVRWPMMAEEETLRAARKVKSLRAVVRAVRTAQAAGLRVVFTNGCFDLL